MPSPADGRPPRCFAVVPAAGVGARLGAAVPKQYLEIGGECVLSRTLRPLLDARWIERVVVVVAPGDARAQAACALLGPAAGSRLRIAPVGGATRRDSVLAGLELLVGEGAAAERDWALVHDAARPGLRAAALERLRERAGAHPVGGLLALPVADTVKRAGAGGEVAATVPRDALWLAQTPQMFRVGALRAALARHPEVTDEAAAMEAEGHAVLLVEGDRRNFKVTTADDLDMMRALLGAGQAA
jgi:2-C-methyl-D-erythritol 4-phosphate cytidylyltransferase